MALAGISENCACNPEVMYLQQIPSVEHLAIEIDSLHPRLLVAIGSKSLEFILASNSGLPVVYAMVLNPWTKVHQESKDVTGVSMNVSPQTYWEAMDHVKPAIRTIGLVYNPATTQILKDHAEKLATEHGQKLIAFPAQNPREALNAIQEMAFQIDAFLMLPDSDFFGHQEIIDSLVSSSFAQKFVLIGLSSKYVKAGALMAYSFNSKAIGHSAGKLVNEILKKSLPVDNNSLIWAPETELTVNLKTARKIGVVIDPLFLKKADTLIE